MWVMEVRVECVSVSVVAVAVAGVDEVVDVVLPNEMSESEW